MTNEETKDKIQQLIKDIEYSGYEDTIELEVSRLSRIVGDILQILKETYG